MAAPSGRSTRSPRTRPAPTRRATARAAASTTTQAGAPAQLEALLDGWRRDGVRQVRFELPDIHGTARVKNVPLDKAAGFARKGLNFYGGAVVLDSQSQVVGGTLYNEETGYADQLLFPDLSTASRVPWAPATARLICEGRFPDGTPQRAAPRYVLRQMVEALAKRGLNAVIGVEYEFYAYDLATRQAPFGGLHIFNVVRNNWLPWLGEFVDMLPQAGVDIITANSEYGPGQFEFNFAPGVGMAGPDAAFTFKNGLKEVARQNNMGASFMTKPYSDQAACGGHLHLSLVDSRTGANAFLDASDPEGISTLCRQFLAGLLEHAPALMAVSAPTVNCYKRFVPYHFAPINASYGFEDRTAAVRVKNSRDASTHIENRLPCGLSNPYLAAASTIAAGILGIEHRSRLRPPYAGNAEADTKAGPLPRTLPAALQALEADKELEGMLGDEFVRAFAAIKRHELGRFEAHVTDWERDEYLEVY